MECNEELIRGLRVVKSKNRNKESQTETSGSRIFFKRKDSKRIPFSMIKTESKQRRKNAEASSENTVPQKVEEADAAKTEGPSTEPAGEEDIGSGRKASLHERNGEQHKKETTFCLTKEYQSAEFE